ncbi:MAG: hypothetical protein BGP10_12485 [Rhodanobacter sp. 68-29]|nr:tyrosine-type recombinase/integrase [Rhodanobacter sp.]ODV28003.1 MAG: hypothetical protein ABT19_00405 [Rhodanobacter sp. SCN 68-63]OJY60707.1 MAG: hypothetical protein BGP10_12485 [Rhodanobacter sp. 68-29]
MPVPPAELDHYNALVNDWLIWLQFNKGRSPKTIDLYQSVLERLAKWCIEPPPAEHLRCGTSDLLAMTLADLERFSGMVCHSQGIGARSRRVFVSAVRGFYAWAHAQGKLPVNVAEHLPYPKAGRPLPRAITLSNADLLLRQPDLATFLGLRDTAIMAVLMGLGLRISGICALNESAMIWTEFEGREDLVIRVVEKGSKERHMPAPREVALLLRAYLGHPELAEIDRTLEDGDRVLFVTVANHMVPACDYRGEARRISEYAVRDLLAKHGAAAKIPADQLNPHALRHLYGTELAEEDASLFANQALMGHNDPKSTEIYAHLAMRKLRRTVDKANPLGKLRTPVLEDLRRIDAAERHPRVPRTHTGPDK